MDWLNCTKFVPNQNWNYVWKRDKAGFYYMYMYYKKKKMLQWCKNKLHVSKMYSIALHVIRLANVICRYTYSMYVKIVIKTWFTF